MKTKEELNALKEGVETVSKKLAKLTEDELAEVTGCSVTLKNMPKKTPDKRYVMANDKSGLVPIP